MNTIKIMSIIGLAWGTLSLLCLIGFATPIDYDAAIGWGIMGMVYFIPFSIVCLVVSSKKLKKRKKVVENKEIDK